MSQQPPPLPGAVELPEPEQPRLYTRGEVRRKRIWFWLGIAGWVLVLLIPFVFVLLAIRGEVTITLPGDVPDNQLRVWMVMEPRERGVAYSLPSVAARESLEMQIETNVRYLLWEGENENLNFCTVYTRADENTDWAYTESAEGECE